VPISSVESLGASVLPSIVLLLHALSQVGNIAVFMACVAVMKVKVFTSAEKSVKWSDNKSLTEILSVNNFDPSVEWKR